MCLPIGSEVATRDVAEAYRTVPLQQSQWPAAVVWISDSHGCIDTCVVFGSTPSAGIYGHVSDAGCEIFRAHGLGPLDKWVDDHIFFRIRKAVLKDYNEAQRSWHDKISEEGMMVSGSRIWYKGATWNDDISDEFNEDCSRPIKDLSGSSHRSEHDVLFTYALCDIDAISRPLGIPWETQKDQPFGPSTVHLGFLWDLKKGRSC